MPNTTLGISCTEEYYAKLKGMALADQRTISSMARVLMDEAIEAREKRRVAAGRYVDSVLRRTGNEDLVSREGR
jgi:hypothetical protein